MYLKVIRDVMILTNAWSFWMGTHSIETCQHRHLALKGTVVQFVRAKAVCGKPLKSIVGLCLY